MTDTTILIAGTAWPRWPYELVDDPTDEQITANQSLLRDPSDLPIALAAINAGVHYLVSEDKDFTARTAQNQVLHQRVPVLLSGTFLRVVMGWTSEELERLRGRQWSDVTGDPHREPRRCRTAARWV